MTQALFNKLNISIEKTVNLVEKMPKTEGLDFGKMFESKTNNYNKQKSFADNAQASMSTSVNKNAGDNKNTTKDTTVDKTANNTQKDKITNDTNKQTVQQNCVQEKTTNNTQEIDTTVKTDKISDTDNTENTITEDELNNINEATITDEEPTMYNELNTLEDPTTMLLLQAQIQKNIKNCLENDSAEDFSEETISQRTNDAILNNNASLFKQLDNTLPKDVNMTSNQFTQMSPKDLVQSKNTNSKISNVINENIVKELNVEVVGSQSAETEASFGDLMQNQSPQEQAARVMIQGDVKFEATAAKAMQNVQVKPTTITPSKIIEQISKQLDGMVNNSKLNMVLNPGTLGKVNVQLMNTKDGLMAQFTVTTQDVKDILMKGLEGLKESLLAQGVNVDNVSVKLEETDGEYKQDYTEQEGSRGGNKQQGSKQQKEKGQSFEELIGANVEEKSEA